jgi:transposase
MKVIKVLGIDLAKNIFQLHGCDETGREVLSKQLSRKRLVEFVSKLPVCVIGMEACGGAHHWGRTFEKMGHEVRMVSPQYVKAYVRGNKTDRNDARAIAECVSRTGMRLVPIKSLHQQEVQMIHCVRRRAVKNRTGLSNEIRGMLAECGYAIPVGYPALKRAILEIVSSERCELSRDTCELLLEMRSELLMWDEKIESYERRLSMVVKESAVCQRLMRIPGIGPITVTAIWAHVGNALLFKNGRQFSAYLGLVPKQYSSGGKSRLMGISKRGDKYIRQLLIHGARAVIRYAADKTDARSLWIQRIDTERGRNKACVALANKNARIIWALMAKGTEYKQPTAA